MQTEQSAVRAEVATNVIVRQVCLNDTSEMTQVTHTQTEGTNTEFSQLPFSNNKHLSNPSIAL